MSTGIGNARKRHIPLERLHGSSDTNEGRRHLFAVVVRG